MTLRAIIWAAVSSEPQAERVSLEQQVAEGREHCETKGYQIAATLEVPGHTRAYIEYADAARDMEAYRQLREHLDARIFDVLVVRDPGRLGREASLVHAVAAYCNQASVKIDFLNLPMTGNPLVDSYLLGIGSANAQNEIRELTRRTKEGMDGRAFRGLPVSVWLPFPYIREQRDPATGRPTGPATLVPERAAALREVVDMLRRGESTNACARYLNARGFHTPRGNPFTVTTLRRLLINPFLAGKVVRHKTRGLRGNGKLQQVAQPESEWLVADGLHEALFTEEEFAEVKRLLVRPEQGRRPGSSHGVWTGILRCGYCGERMHINVSYKQANGKEWKNAGYICGGYYKHLSRHLNYISEPRVTRLIIDAVAASLADVSDSAVAIDAPPPVPDYSDDFADLDRRQKAAYMAFEDGLLPIEEYASRKRELDAMQRVLEDRQEADRRRLETAERRKGQQAALRDLLPRLPDMIEAMPKREVNAVLRNLFDEIVVKDKVVVSVS